MIKDRSFLTAVTISMVIVSGCSSSSSPKETVLTKPIGMKSIKVTYWEGALSGGVRAAIRLTRERLKRTGQTKEVSSNDLHSRLFAISKLECILDKDENIAALAESEGIAIEIQYNKKIATSKGVCDIPFTEADSIIKQLGLNFKHHKKGYDLY